MPPTSTQSRDCGPASRAWSWPTWPASASTRSSRRPSVASSGSARPTTCPSRSCATAAYTYGERPCHWKERTSVGSTCCPPGGQQPGAQAHLLFLQTEAPGSGGGQLPLQLFHLPAKGFDGL